MIAGILTHILREQSARAEKSDSSVCSFTATDVELDLKSHQFSQYLKSEEKEITNMVFALIIGLADHRLKDKTTDVLKGICKHFALRCDKIGKSNDRVDAGKRFVVDDSHTSAFVLHDAIIASLADIRPAVQSAGRYFFCIWLRAVEEVKGRRVSAPPEADNMSINTVKHVVSLNSRDVVIADLLRKAQGMCLETEWTSRLAGARVVNELCELLPPKWCSLDEADIIASLLFAIKFTGNELVLFACEEILSCLKHVVKCNHGTADSIASEKTDNVDISFTSTLDSVAVLVQSVRSPNNAIRSVSKYLLTMLSDLSIVTLLELLRPAIDRIRNMLLSRIGISFASSEGIGLISAYAFFLRAKAPDVAADDFALNVSDDVLVTLREVIEATEAESIPADILVGLRCAGPNQCFVDRGFGDHDDINLLVACLPNKIPLAVELRLQAIRLINVGLTSCLSFLFFHFLF